MEYFEKYTSNTYAGSGNQLFFEMEEGEVRTGRIFYKISAGGEYNYSLLFSNIMDSTYSDGSVSHKNHVCEGWKIHGAKIGKCKSLETADDIEKTDANTIVVSDFKALTFDGKESKNVNPGEFFATDPVKLNFEKDEYLCLEMTFSGKMIPYHEESLLPVFIKENDGWKYCRKMPFAGMVGCDRRVKARVAYLGDSITQGIGTKPNSYLHWNALLSRKLGEEYGFWNLGIGFGRAADAASDGAWLYKAKQNDVVFVCYGVNDILKSVPEEQIKADLTFITDTLKKLDKKVILQTVPPFDYEGENIEKWKRINEYIKTVLVKKADCIFDNVPYLGEKDCPQKATYGGHPKEEGCEIWAEALYEAVRGFFDEKL